MTSLKNFPFFNDQLLYNYQKEPIRGTKWDSLIIDFDDNTPRQLKR